MRFQSIESTSPFDSFDSASIGMKERLKQKHSTTALHPSWYPIHADCPFLLPQVPRFYYCHEQYHQPSHQQCQRRPRQQIARRIGKVPKGSWPVAPQPGIGFGTLPFDQGGRRSTPQDRTNLARQAQTPDGTNCKDWVRDGTLGGKGRKDQRRRKWK